MSRFEGLKNNRPVSMDEAKPFTEEDFNAGMKALRERGPQDQREHESYSVKLCMASGVISEETGKRIIKRLEEGNNEN